METDFRPFDWQRMLFGDQPLPYYFEVLLKILVVFALLMLVMRLIGKRGQKNLSPMQQMMLIALGSAAGDALLYPTVALGYAAVVLIGVTLLNTGMERLSERFRPVRNQIESCPRVLVRDGQVDTEALHEERTTERELYAELRAAGARSIEQVEVAILEVTGGISVFLNDRHAPHDDLLDYLLDGPADGSGPDDAPGPSQVPDRH